MGFGDDLIASGMAKGRKRVAFGDGKRIIWGPWSEEIFRHNPNIAKPGTESQGGLHWINYYKGHRNYNSMNAERTRWKWNYSFTAVPGEIYFSGDEWKFAGTVGHDFILIEPNVPWHKSVAVNKDWGLQKYQAVADRLLAMGNDVVQTSFGRERLKGVRTVATPTFRHALALLAKARGAVLPEGGLHHGAAALGIRAVVLFGGFIPPEVTGYPLHVNLTGGAEACGSLSRCSHCREALNRISVDEVCAGIHERALAT